jgi:hypothetical protein
VDGQTGCVRKRHDGGLRFGANNGELEIYVVWVERKELNYSKIPAPPQSGGAKHVKVEHNTYYMRTYHLEYAEQVSSTFWLASPILFETGPYYHRSKSQPHASQEHKTITLLTRIHKRDDRDRVNKRLY